MSMRRVVRLGALLTGTVLVTTACLGEGGGSGGGGGEGGGGSVEIVGAISGPNEVALQEEMAAISEATGLDVTYTTLPDFDTVIQSRTRGNNAPDIALFPQPGVMRDLYAGDNLVPLSTLVDTDAIAEQMVPGAGEIVVTEDGEVLGLPASINIKSLVWHPIPEFQDAGYAEPSTHQELVELSNQMKADGTPPWCFAFEAQAATGWYVTDWIEEYVLRIGGPEVYDQWVNHEIPFNDPVVVQAAEAFEELVLADGNAVLNRQAMAATPWGDAMQPLVADPPGCFMAKQGNFIIGFWPPEVQQNAQDVVGTFLLPQYEGGFEGTPVLGGGDLVGAFNDDEATVQVVEAMLSPDFGETWAQTEGNEFLSPFPEFDSSNYFNEITASVAGLIAEADAFRFDASDLMPGQVGSGSFWTEMTAWVSGQTDLETALQNIENSWPTQ